MKKLILVITLVVFGTSALAVPSNADAFWWTIVRAVVSPKPTIKPKAKQKNDWWENEGKDSKGWSPDVDENHPDWKQLNYREKDWYK